MNKINLESVLNLLLSEGKEAAAPLMHKYIIETCLEINDSIIKEDGEEIDVDADTDLSSGEGDEGTSAAEPAVLTVFYKDPDGDCDYDSAILALIGREDMDGAGWADGIRTLVFQFDSEEAAEEAADKIANRTDEDGLPEEISTDVASIDFDDDSSEETIEETEESEVNPEGEQSPVGSTEEEPISEEEGSEEPASEDGEEDSDFSDIFADPEESDSDKILDLASEIEELKRQIEELSSEDNTVEEGFEFEKVKPVVTPQGKESGAGGITKINDTSLIPGNTETVDQRLDHAKPIQIKDKPHKGYEREAAPTIKTVDVGARNVRKDAEEGMESVSKEGDASAIINKDQGKENDTSIISGK